MLFEMAKIHKVETSSEGLGLWVDKIRISLNLKKYGFLSFSLFWKNFTIYSQCRILWTLCIMCYGVWYGILCYNFCNKTAAMLSSSVRL